MFRNILLVVTVSLCAFWQQCYPDSLPNEHKHVFEFVSANSYVEIGFKIDTITLLSVITLKNVSDANMYILPEHNMKVGIIVETQKPNLLWIYNFREPLDTIFPLLLNPIEPGESMELEIVNEELVQYVGEIHLIKEFKIHTHFLRDLDRVRDFDEVDKNWIIPSDQFAYNSETVLFEGLIYKKY